MKKSTPLLLIVCFVWANSRAQLPVSLNLARQLAVENQIANQNKQLNASLADQQYTQGRQRFKPQLSLSYDLRSNLVRPTNIIPGEAFNQPEDLEIQFGTLWANTAALDVSQYIFDKSIRIDQQLLDLNRNIADAQIRVGQDEIQLAAIKAYYNVLIQRARLKQQEAAIARLQTDVADADARVQSGLALPIERERFQNSFKNALLERERILSGIQVAELTLKYTMGLPLDQELVLTDTLDFTSLRAAELLPPAETPADWNNLAEYQAEQLQLKRLDLISNRQKALALPSVNAYGYLAGQSFTNDYFEKFPWYGVAYIGVRAVWRLNPLWDNKQVLPQYEIQRKQVENNLRLIQNDLDYRSRQTRTLLLQAIQDAEIQADNLAFAQKDLAYTTTRFQSQLATSRDVVEAEESLAAAETGLLLAVYNVHIARYEYLKAVGKL